MVEADEDAAGVGVGGAAGRGSILAVVSSGGRGPDCWPRPAARCQGGASTESVARAAAVSLSHGPDVDAERVPEPDRSAGVLPEPFPVPDAAGVGVSPGSFAELTQCSSRVPDQA